MVVCFPRSAKVAIEEPNEFVDTPSPTSVADVVEASPFEFDVPVTKPTKKLADFTNVDEKATRTAERRKQAKRVFGVFGKSRDTLTQRAHLRRWMMGRRRPSLSYYFIPLLLLYIC